MPYYDLRCNNCGLTITRKLYPNECDKIPCHMCGHILRVIIHPVPFIFKEKN